jgi:uncharacterized membrane protein YphA (DoxX/SURF4 family)
MSIFTRLEQWHSHAKQNKWLRYFTVFNRLILAAGFIPSGLVKIMGERFTALSANHPMGHYLEALHQTGFYYTFIGIIQVTAAILLLIPATATLGAILYFPLILNICILSFAVRFDGSLLFSPLMVLANLYLLCWDYDKLKFIFIRPADSGTAKPKVISTRFPVAFFTGVFVTIAIVTLTVLNLYEVRPYNTSSDCKNQFKGTNRTQAGRHFCDCIHKYGQPLTKCLDEYSSAPDDTLVTTKSLNRE